MIRSIARVIIEPYDISVIEQGRSKCGFCNNVMRVNEEDYFDLFAGDGGYTTGTFIYCRKGYMTPGNVRFGSYAYADGMYFLEEEVPNFYA